MSKLEKLIARLCPDGVEYKELGDIGTLTRGKRFVHADAVENGIPCIHYGELYTYYGISTESTKSFVRYELHDKLRYASKNDVIIVGAGENDIDIGIAVAYMGEKEVAVHDACYILKHNQDPKYLSYCLRTSFYHEQIKKYVSSGKICAISSKGLSKAKLPVPPLEVQREIVHILDSFTLLTAELAAELAARQKQYEFYRDMLFASVEAEYLPIPSFAKTYIGLVTTMTQHYVNDGVKLLFNSSVRENRFEFPKKIYLDREFAEKNESRKHRLGDIITVHTGDVGTSAIIDESLDGSLGFATIVTRIYEQDRIMPKYVSYYLNSKENKNNIIRLIKGDRNNLNLKDFNKLSVPVPPLAEQQRIVDILDRFDALCNDISSGLPAEIEARQKQYEYYRDKLLTFKELKKEA